MLFLFVRSDLIRYRVIVSQTTKGKIKMQNTYTAIYHAFPSTLIQRHFQTLQAAREDYALMKKEALKTGKKFNRVQIYKKSQIKAIYDGPLK